MLKTIRWCYMGLCIAGALLLMTFVQPAGASPITVTGGFTKFVGLSGGANADFTQISPDCSPAGFQGFVAGTLVQTAACVPIGGISGPASLTFPSTLGSFEFFNAQFFGDAAHNALSFVPAPTTDVTDINGPFVLGTLSFTNGVWFGTGSVNSFHLQITATSPDPLFGTQTLSDDFVLNIRLGSTPEDNADCWSFSQFANVGLFCAYETGVPGKPSTTTVTLMGKKGSLIPTEFTDVTGGFVIPGTPAQEVPEPTSLVLIGLGFAGLGWSRRRR